MTIPKKALTPCGGGSEGVADPSTKYQWHSVGAAALVVGALSIPGSAWAASASNSAASPQCRQLDASLTWHTGVREFLQSAIDKHSTCTGTAGSGERKVAIFDWDDTVIKNGVGYSMNYYMVRNGLVLQPPRQDWRTLHRYLSDAAAKALRSACGTSVAAGEPLPTHTNVACADEILALLDNKTTRGDPAFVGFNARRMEAAYLWSAALSTGYTTEQLEDFARKVRAQNLSAPIGAKQTVGSKTVNAYNRYYPQIADLIGTLQAHGIEAWVVSASPEPIVRVWSAQVGIDAAHTIGIRSLYDEHGRQTPHVLGCGGVPDGDDSVIPYIEGKRCWANQVIFGVTGKAAWNPLPPERRQIMAGGDSVTDVTFVGDATAASLAINRNKAEFMCHAYDGLFTQGGTWAVNPMFIEPLRQHAPYQCASAFTHPDGSKGAVLRQDGSAIPDQADSVY